MALQQARNENEVAFGKKCIESAAEVACFAIRSAIRKQHNLVTRQTFSDFAVDLAFSSLVVVFSN